MKHLQTFRYIEGVMKAGSIRKAADDMNITASALNRRIQRFEEEFGSEIFERLPRGVKLNPAGELLMQHFRAQASDLRRVQSHVADLSGERRGHITLACSQALIPYFLPAQIAAYRRDHPGVTFSVVVRDREAAERELATFRSDLALVFEPVHLVDFEVLMAVPQVIHAIMRRDNPLAAEREVRLRDCLDQPHLVPTAQYGVRAMLDMAVARGSRTIRPIAESDSFDFMRHYVRHENAIAFQIPIGLNVDEVDELVIRPLSTRDLPAGNLLLGQMRGRTLPVASARFAQGLARVLGDMT
ncbi:LysR family transcriptional regulator [Roseisalinus antarcticus]|uniref:HTH-type transcriptional activator CmpR n=1 Tax=Roseisalinus antarcticus TaxID=254357 RepID=A0A1Y5RFY9_9RHOB|nr:LysR family transcriptional regulator [Roseisalinus antarcticus]SLN15339.1 HTH-type transcriptional activator CmpR [Roseisalinus antarcticus]